MQQVEVKTRPAQLENQGKVKIAVLEGDGKCLNLIASSLYNTKTAHYLSMVCKLIRWIDLLILRCF